jgi:hypothetical protein
LHSGLLRESVTYLAQTVFFCPRGLPGFLYWYLFYPFHVFGSNGFLKRIAQDTKSQ